MNSTGTTTKRNSFFLQIGNSVRPCSFDKIKFDNFVDSFTFPLTKISRFKSVHRLTGIFPGKHSHIFLLSPTSFRWKIIAFILLVWYQLLGLKDNLMQMRFSLRRWWMTIFFVFMITIFRCKFMLYYLMLLLSKRLMCFPRSINFKYISYLLRFFIILTIHYYTTFAKHW